MTTHDLQPSLIDICDTTSTTNKSQFNSDKIEALAQSILETGNVARPLLVKRLTYDTYTVLRGHLEFHAAVRASEIDDNFEMVRAFIVEPDQETAVIAQLNLYQEQETSPLATPVPIPMPSLESSSASLEAIAQLIDQKLEPISKTLSEAPGPGLSAEDISNLIDEKLKEISPEPTSGSSGEDIGQAINRMIDECVAGNVKATITLTLSPQKDISISELSDATLREMYGAWKVDNLKRKIRSMGGTVKKGADLVETVIKLHREQG